MDDSDQMTLNAFLTRAAGGDSTAFDAVVLRLGRDLRVFVAAHAANRDELEEICQATWVIAWEQLATWRGDAPFDHWLRGIARNLLRRAMGERRRRRTHSGLDQLDLAVADAGLEDLDREDDPRLRRLPDCLQRLAPRTLALLLARDRDGVSLADLAQRFKRPMGAIATALWRARAGLRACLDTDGR